MISLSPKSLWKQINEEAMTYYKFDLNSDNVDGMQNSHLLKYLPIFDDQRKSCTVDSRNSVSCNSRIS